MGVLEEDRIDRASTVSQRLSIIKPNPLRYSKTPSTVTRKALVIHVRLSVRDQK